MNTSTVIANPLLRQAFGRRARHSSLNVLQETGALLSGACPSLGVRRRPDVGAAREDTYLNRMSTDRAPSLPAPSHARQAGRSGVSAVVAEVFVNDAG